MKLPVLGLAALALCVAAASSAAAPLPSRNAKSPQDLGRLARSETLTATVALSLRNADRLPGLMADLYDRQGAQYRRFLSPAEFQARFGPSEDSLRRVSADLRAAGLTVEQVGANLLRVTGKAASLEQAFGVELHGFQLPEPRSMAVTRFHAPAAAPRLRPEWSGLVEGVVGLDDRPRYHPHSVKHAARTPSASRPLAGAPNTPDAPGEWTVTDFAQYYDVAPLYKSGISGKGQTIGIVTLASFTPSDVFAYWNALGLNTSPNRLKVVDIDNGPGAPSDASGSDETTLDVEQSGGIAPGAKLIVYQAPNTDQGFVDAFARAIGDNKADAISTSWGAWEEEVDGVPVTDPSSGRTVNELRAFHNLFIQAAIQGQSLFAAAGDSGSYDGNGDFPLPQFTTVLSVDHPASDPFITAAGGTTLPGEQDFLLADGSTYVVKIGAERGWSWDYLDGLCKALGYDPVDCGTFPVGGGGGVSVLYGVPSYQNWIPGIRASQPNQSLVDTSVKPKQILITLPAHYAGRNLPDISFNADPDTGYAVLYTSDQTGLGVQTFWGGTSFVAPQLAGVTALVDGAAGGRVGLLNFPLYELARWNALYSGRNPAARDITKGNNEFYKADEGYDLATGLGVLDVANFAAWFR